MKLVRKLATAVSSAALLTYYTTVPAFAAVNITISGNGADSDNTVGVTQTQSSGITQTNNADINNIVNISAETGDNTASDNTGGDVDVTSGDVSATSDVQNVANQNVAEVSAGNLGNATLTVADNGAGNDNTVALSGITSYSLVQGSTADVTNNVRIAAESGDNTADDNTNGEVSISSGNVLADSSVVNDLNSNYASLGADTANGDFVIDILRNGADSENLVTLSSSRLVALAQTNAANLDNIVREVAESGDNTASDNTGGDVDIFTGNVDASALVDNAVNFNSAEVGSGAFDLTGAISDNGADSVSTIGYTDTVTLSDTQGNTLVADDNNLGLTADTGDNTSDDNTTGEVKTDTGESTVDVDLYNEANINDLLTL